MRGGVSYGEELKDIPYKGLSAYCFYGGMTGKFNKWGILDPTAMMGVNRAHYMTSTQGANTAVIVIEDIREAKALMGM